MNALEVWGVSGCKYCYRFFRIVLLVGGGLSQSQEFAALWCKVGGFVVHLVEAFEAYAVSLADGVHAFAGLYDVGFVGFACFAVFLFEVDDVSALQGVAFVQVVVFAEFAL